LERVRRRALARAPWLVVAGLIGAPALASRPVMAPARSGVEHVLLVGVDGLSPEGITRTDTPALHELMANGTYTLHARGVIPTVSSPNWASMLMAAGPEQHGVATNDWTPDQFDIPPVATGLGSIFPTIVGELRRVRPDAMIGVFHDWDGFGRLIERDAATVVADLDGPEKTGARALAWFADCRPTLTIVQLDHVDLAGHEHGWLSQPYLDAVREADRLIRTLLTSLRDRRLLDRTAIIVSADHGGIGTEHGGPTSAEIEIPWIAAGAGIANGRELKIPVSTIDTAATIAHLLDVPLHPAWIGRPVRAALKAQ
jgi:predicted AlkP superfamily pyrophosphatase or phosphodiesterase